MCETHGMPSDSFPTTYPLIYCSDVAATSSFLCDLGFEEVWRVGEPEVDHAEVAFAGGVVSLNRRTQEFMELGTSSVAIRCKSAAEVDELYARAIEIGADVFHSLDDSFVARQFTLKDADGNVFWFHFETGALDDLRAKATQAP